MKGKGKRNNYLLLEVLIAFTIVALALLPILEPHLEMLRQEKVFIREVEADRVAQLLYADLLEKGFYQQGVFWNAIVTEELFEIIDPRLDAINFRGYYKMKAIRKQRGELSENIRNYLIRITLILVSSEREKPLEFIHVLAVKHGGEQSIPGEEPEGDEIIEEEANEKN